MALREVGKRRHLALYSRPAQAFDRVEVVVDADGSEDEGLHHAKEGTTAASGVDYAIRGPHLARDLSEFPPRRLVRNCGHQLPLKGRITRKVSAKNWSPHVPRSYGTNVPPGSSGNASSEKSAPHWRPRRLRTASAVTVQTQCSRARRTPDRQADELRPERRSQRSHTMRSARPVYASCASRAEGGASKTYSLQPIPPPHVLRRRNSKPSRWMNAKTSSGFATSNG
jgi:hypothetical protein